MLSPRCASVCGPTVKHGVRTDTELWALIMQYSVALPTEQRCCGYQAQSHIPPFNMYLACLLQGRLCLQHWKQVTAEIRLCFPELLLWGGR